MKPAEVERIREKVEALPILEPNAMSSRGEEREYMGWNYCRQHILNIIDGKEKELEW